MRPPICAICGKENLKSGEMSLISFKKTKSDKEWEKKSKQKGFVGHPPWKEWFCKEHVKEARNLCHLPLREAMEELSKEFSSDKP